MRTLALTLVAVLALEGCSMMLTRPPPENHEPLPDHDACSASYGAPLVDTTLALAFASGAFAIAANHDEIQDVGMPATPAAIGVGIWALIFGLSAGLGFKNAADCRDARAQLLETGTSPTTN